ncbi:hypothetical protein FGG08_001257 [Glutinoglossum americanum]|uniref:Poly [ADP-ribose] polymerase n=1 Tax=Glutinoglossum americanum TaxID=1670608 RepID=A0A9P8IBV1_9PEZI|nr:hypothetical protein FGG08_001257 [Glutinoglossum americanum]
MVFAGQTISFSGTFPGYKQASLGAIVLGNGGRISSKVDEDCTHLVTSQADFEKPSIKNKQAQDIPDLKVVSLDWLLESVQNKQLESEASYALGASKASVSRQGVGVPPKSTGVDSNTNPKTRDATANASSSVAKVDDKIDITNKTSSKGRKRTRKAATPVSDNSADGAAEDNEPAAKKFKDGQKAKSTSLSIPVDEGCHLFGTHEVYIDPDGIIYDAALNQTNVSNNNNKFYRVQLLVSTSNPKDYRTWTRWGRVGEHGQTALLGGGTLEIAMMQFEKKFKDKSGHQWANRLDPAKANKYTFIEKNYEESDDDEDVVGGASSSKPLKKVEKEKLPEVKSALPQPVQRLMQLIFNQSYFANTMASMEYDANKLPLGKLSKRTLENGFQMLKNLAEVLSDPSVAASKHTMSPPEAIQHFTNQYYSVIPHSFGRLRPPVINTEAMMKREIELLESLADMEIANEIMKVAKGHTGEAGNPIHPLDKQYHGLGMQEMTPLEAGSVEFKELEEYLIKSHGHTHQYEILTGDGVSYPLTSLNFSSRLKIQDIFRIERHGEFDRFDKSPFAKSKTSDRRLLWHGSRCTNFGGILSQGLRIAPPEAPVSGYMFGKGVYLADISSKSAGYCYPELSGNHALLLLCEAELGKPMLELTNSDYHAGDLAQAKGMIATWGKGLTGPAAWKDASCVNPDLKGVMMVRIMTFEIPP